MLAVTAVKTLGADREAITDVLLGSCQRLCVHRAMHFDGDSDGPKNAHRMPVSMVDAARCMLDVISCRADDIAGKGVNISAGSSREDASFGASCARRLEKKEGSDRWVERTKRFSASKCPKHYGSSRSIGIKLAPGGGSLRARALSRGSVGTLCGTGHCLSADRQNGSPASRTLPLQPSLPLGPLHLLSLLTCPAAAQHETCIRKTAAYPAENESPPRATTVSLAAAAASLAPTAPHTACTLFVRTRWLDGGKNQHAASSPDAPRPKLRPRSHLIRHTSYVPATQHGAADSAIVAPPTPAIQHRHPATDAPPSQGGRGGRKGRGCGRGGRKRRGATREEGTEGRGGGVGGRWRLARNSSNSVRRARRPRGGPSMQRTRLDCSES